MSAGRTTARTPGRVANSDGWRARKSDDRQRTHAAAPRTVQRLLALQQAAGNDATHALVAAQPPTPRRTRASSGTPLPGDIRDEMQERLGHDFSAVRVHTDDGEASTADVIGANAFTVGRDVAFGSGRFAPGTIEGKQLLAHELAHVVQQSRGGSMPPLDPSAPHEHAARDAAAATVGSSGPVAVAGSTGVGVAADFGDWLKKKYEENVAPAIRDTVSDVKQPMTDDLKDFARDKIDEAVGTTKGAVGQLTGAIDTVIWAGTELRAVKKNAVTKVANAAGADPEKALTAVNAFVAVSPMAPTLGAVEGLGDISDLMMSAGMVDESGKASLTDPTLKGWDYIGDYAIDVIGAKKDDDPNSFSKRDIAEIESAVGVQVALAFTGEEEVKVALGVLGVLGGLQGVVETIRAKPDSFYKEPGFWSGILSSLLSLVGLAGGSGAGKKIIQIMVTSGAVMTAVPPLIQLYHDWDDESLKADPEKRHTRLKADWQAAISALLLAVKAIIDHRGSQPMKTKGSTGEPETKATPTMSGTDESSKKTATTPSDTTSTTGTPTETKTTTGTPAEKSTTSATATEEAPSAADQKKALRQRRRATKQAKKAEDAASKREDAATRTRKTADDQKARAKKAEDTAQRHQDEADNKAATADKRKTDATAKAGERDRARQRAEAQADENDAKAQKKLDRDASNADKAAKNAEKRATSAQKSSDDAGAKAERSRARADDAQAHAKEAQKEAQKAKRAATRARAKADRAWDKANSLTPQDPGGSFAGINQPGDANLPGQFAPNKEPIVWVRTGKGKTRNTYVSEGDNRFGKRSGVALPESEAKELWGARPAGKAGEKTTPSDITPMEIGGRQVESRKAGGEKGSNFISATAEDPAAVNTTSIPADVAEAASYKVLVKDQGEIGILRPLGSNVKGVDSITAKIEFNTKGEPTRAQIFLNDATTPGAAKFEKPTHMEWKGALERALTVRDGEPPLFSDPKIDAALQDALRRGDVFVRIVRVQHSPGGKPIVTINPSETWRVGPIPMPKTPILVKPPDRDEDEEEPQP